MDLTSKIVVITGGGGGWGQTVVEAFLNANASVVVIERPRVVEDIEIWKQRKLGERSSRLSCVAGDVLNEASVERMMQQVLDQHGRLDVLVNIVGGFTM
ncbi:MAG TPA: SDR family NAD(P)-dependent oxidoreductase, partial [Ktedonobacterales bacterium]